MENIFNTYFYFIIDLYLFCYIYYINFNRINKIKNIKYTHLMNTTINFVI